MIRHGFANDMRDVSNAETQSGAVPVKIAKPYGPGNRSLLAPLAMQARFVPAPLH